MNDALLSRSLTVDLSMTPTDKVERITSILPSIMPEYSLDAKIDALKFLTEVKDQVNLNIRMFIMVTKMRVSFPENWRDMAKYMIKG